MIKLQLWSQTFPCISVRSYSLSSVRAGMSVVWGIPLLVAKCIQLNFDCIPWQQWHPIEAQDNVEWPLKWKMIFRRTVLACIGSGSVAPWSEQFFPLTLHRWRSLFRVTGIRLEYRLDPAAGTSATLRSWKCTHFIQCLFMYVLEMFVLRMGWPKRLEKGELQRHGGTTHTIMAEVKNEWSNNGNYNINSWPL